MVSTGAGVTPSVEVLHDASTTRPAINAARDLPGLPIGVLFHARRTAGRRVSPQCQGQGQLREPGTASPIPRSFSMARAGTHQPWKPLSLAGSARLLCAPSPARLPLSIGQECSGKPRLPLLPGGIPRRSFGSSWLICWWCGSCLKCMTKNASMHRPQVLPMLGLA